MRKSDNQRRPPRGGRDSRGSRDSRDPKERMEKDFSREIEMRIGYFLDSDEAELELEPMNSFRRRVVHTLAKDYNLGSESRGEDRDRYVALLKSGDTPEVSPKKPRLWDFGNQTFPVNPGKKGIHLALKIDGTIEIFQESEKKNTVNDRVVTSTEMRVRKGLILTPEDSDY